MVIIGITGTDGAGKGALVEYLKDTWQFVHYSARAMWVEEIKKRGLPVDREHMRLVANDLRGKHGNDHFAVESIRRARAAGDERAVLESFRALAEVHYLKKEGGILLAVDADQRTRFSRIQARASESDKIDFETFVEHEALEMDDPDPHGMQKRAVIDAADHTISNDGTLDELHAQIDDLMRTLDIA